MSKRSVRYTIHFLTAVSITAMVLFVIYGMQNGLFTDRTKMEMLIERGGIFGPLFFIFIQMVQVVVPIILAGFPVQQVRSCLDHGWDFYTIISGS